MSAAQINTRKLGGLDYHVWKVMLMLCFASLAVLGYKKIEAARTINGICPTSHITVDKRMGDHMLVCNINSNLLFDLDVKERTDIIWDFGDGSDGAKGQPVQHMYKAAGTYEVRAKLPEGCEFVQEVTVKHPLNLPPDNLKVEVFADPKTLKAGDSLKFYAIVNKPIAEYEWRVEETNDSRYGPTASFAFRTPGKYTVRLAVNNDPSTTRFKTFEVAPADAVFPSLPTETPSFSGGNPSVPTEIMARGEDPFASQGRPVGSGRTATNSRDSTRSQSPSTQAKPPVIATDIDVDSFKGLLQGVLDGEISLLSLYQYLHYDETTMVKVNNEKDLIRLDRFCSKFDGKKIESLSFGRDSTNGIYPINVKLKRGGLFGIRL